MFCNSLHFVEWLHSNSKIWFSHILKTSPQCKDYKSNTVYPTLMLQIISVSPLYLIQAQIQSPGCICSSCRQSPAAHSCCSPSSWQHRSSARRRCGRLQLRWRRLLRTQATSGPWCDRLVTAGSAASFLYKLIKNVSTSLLGKQTILCWFVLQHSTKGIQPASDLG